jgi:hypothetical protein
MERLDEIPTPTGNNTKFLPQQRTIRNSYPNRESILNFYSSCRAGVQYIMYLCLSVRKAYSSHRLPTNVVPYPPSPPPPSPLIFTLYHLSLYFCPLLCIFFLSNFNFSSFFLFFFLYLFSLSSFFLVPLLSSQWRWLTFCHLWFIQQWKSLFQIFYSYEIESQYGT